MQYAGARFIQIFGLNHSRVLRAFLACLCLRAVPVLASSFACGLRSECTCEQGLGHFFHCVTAFRGACELGLGRFFHVWLHAEVPASGFRAFFPLCGCIPRCLRSKFRAFFPSCGCMPRCLRVGLGRFFHHVAA